MPPEEKRPPHACLFIGGLLDGQIRIVPDRLKTKVDVEFADTPIIPIEGDPITGIVGRLERYLLMTVLRRGDRPYPIFYHSVLTRREAHERAQKYFAAQPPGRLFMSPPPRELGNPERCGFIWEPSDYQKAMIDLFDEEPGGARKAKGQWGPAVPVTNENDLPF